jgi:ABC-type uncharacterized transport system substrate-binding protein
MTVAAAEGLHVDRSANGLTISFVVSASKPVDLKSTPAQIEVYDRSFFTEFVLGDGKNVTVEATGSPATCTATVIMAPDSDQQKAISALLKILPRADAKLAPAKAISVACKQ